MAAVEHHCEYYQRGHIVTTSGCGSDGGLAEFMIAPRSEAISIGDRDPVIYAPLTNAGVTAYHAILTFLYRIRPGSIAAVIGIGGLWHICCAVPEILREHS